MVYIKLQLIGKNIDFDFITQQIGTNPTFSCKKGDISTTFIGKREAKAINDSWIYNMETNEFSEELLEKFLNKFSGCANLFAHLREKDIIPYLSIIMNLDSF